MLYALIVAAIVIFIAEQGDKTQILAFALATKYKAWQVLLGIVMVNSVMLLVFALAGRLVGSLLPEFWVWIVSGIALVAFGIHSIVSQEDEAADVEDAQGRFGKYGPVITTAGLFFLAEIADSAELLTMAIAANPAGPLGSLGAFGRGLDRSLAGLGVTAVHASPTATLVGVWIGAVLGLTLADALAVAVGRLLGRRLPERLLRRVSGTIFLVGGLVMLGAAVWSKLR
jgi:putative Ca2+/H+ antiporter (TMEM165/GDT1 family)